MDYNYIEQLLKLYWQCETSLQEEDILRKFFAQDILPQGMEKYRALFAAQTPAGQELDETFDEKVLQAIDEPRPVKARVVGIGQHLIPLLKAAAVVAVVFSLGNIARYSLAGDDGGDDINYADYKDTYQDPAMAYDNVEDALQLISEGISQASQTDSLLAGPRTEVDSLRKE